MGSVLLIDGVPEKQVEQQRSLHRENGVSDQYPVSCRLYSKGFPQGIHAEVINYHYGGACLRFQADEIFQVNHIIQQSLNLDFFLGTHLLKSGVPVRVAWHEVSLPNLLGVQFLVETRDFIERSRRFKVNETYEPTISARDPLDIHRTLYFKVRNFSGGGLLLNTSLTNKHLFPGMILRKATLSVPGQQNVSLDLKIENARKGDSDSAFDLGVSIQNDSREFRGVIQTYVNHLVHEYDLSEDLFSDGVGKRKHVVDLASGLTFRIISEEKDYAEVLGLRYIGYGIKGKVKIGSSLQDQGDGLAQEGTIIGAYLGGKLVASMELRFGKSERKFRVFRYVEASVLAELNLDYENMVEMNKLVVHPHAQGTDVLIGMIQKAHAICLTKGALDVMLFATDGLKPMYLRLGARETGIEFPHPFLPGVTLHVLILTKDSFLEGRFMKSEVWAKYFEETNRFYDEQIFKNGIFKPARNVLLNKIKGMVGASTAENPEVRENFVFHERSGNGFVDPKWTKPHFSAPVIFPYLLAGDRIIGAVKVDAILADLGISRAYFRSQHNWISVEFLDAYLDAFSLHGNIDDVSRMSGKLTFDKEVIGLNYYILRHFLSPEIAFRAMASTVKKFNLTRTCEVDLSPGCCLVKLGLVARDLLPKHRSSELNWLENLTAYIRVLTNGRGQVEQINSCYDLEEKSIFKVTWPVRSQRSQLISKSLQYTGLAAVAAVAITPASGLAAGLFAGALAVAVVKMLELNSAKKQKHYNMADVAKRIDEINEDNTKKYEDLQTAKQRLDKRYVEAQLLDESARSIQSCDDLVGIHRTALKTVCGRFGFTRAFVMVLDEDRKNLKTSAIEGMSENSEKLWRYRVDISTKRENALFLSSAFHSGQAVVINDLAAHVFQLNEQSQSVLKSLGGAKGFTIIPIPGASGSAGVLIAERDTEKFPIRQEDIVILQRLCQHIGIAIERFGKLEKEQKLRTLFQKYVPQAVLDSLLLEATPVLGGIQKEIVCMFLDIRGFTRMSATLPPEVIISILNRIFAVVGSMVEISGGVIDKFLGDGVLAVWGSVPGGNTNVAAIFTAIQKMEIDLESLNKEFETQGLPVIKVGVGLHKGPAIVGNIGSVDRLEFTCIGNAVNLASRLEGLCKQFDTNLVVSVSSFPEAAGLPTFRRVEAVEIRGMDEKIDIFVQDLTNKQLN